MNEILTLWEALRARGQEASADTLCQAYPERKEEVARWLRVLQAVYQALGVEVGATGQTLDHANVPARGPATAEELPTVPGYQILGRLGRGGMGVVYRARQVGLNRLVALKMILVDSLAEEQTRARFQAEAHAVARLGHPNIVQIYDVGEIHGRPFFALEYVEGGSLAQRLDGTPWPSHAAARLVRMLAEAMEAAHRAGVVHRDLKPANILLQVQSSQVQSKSDPATLNFELSNLELINAKIADFGLAKQMDSEQAHTRTGAIMGTPSYMAPEQAQGRNAEIGPACDVYALGAILYELLTGRPPFKAATTWETVCQVIGQEPVAVRQLQPGTSRDLETICHKCLHKEIGRRYASAQELADDLGRFLAGEPVHARPVRQIERVWRWCRRNPLPAGFAAMTLMAILVAFVLITHSRNEAVGLAHEKERLAESERLAKDHAMTSAAAAARAKDAETNQRKQAEAVVGVLETVFRSVDPRSAGADFKGQLIAQLDAAADQLEKRYAGAPLVRARLRQVLGQTQLSLGEYRKAVTLLERAVAEGRQALGGQDPAVLRTMSDLAHAYQDLGQRDRARRLYEQTLPALKTALGPDHGSTLLAMNGLANLYRETGQSARAIPLYEEILTRAKNKPELGDGFTIGVTGNLAVAYQYTGQVKRAIHLYEETLPKLRSLYGSSNFLVLLIADNLASAYLHGGQWARALPLYEEALRGKRARYGPNHPATLSTMANLAAAYQEAGQLDKARKLLEDTLPRMEARVGPKHMNTLVIRASLANVYLDSGRAQQAVKLFKQALDGMRSRLPPGHPYTLETMANLALAYQDTGELDRADTLLRESLTLWRKRGDDKVGMARTLAMLGDNLLRQRKYPAAEAVLRETIAVFQKETSDSWETFNAQASLGAALLGQRKDKEAEVLLVKAYEGMKQHASEIPPRGRSIPTVTARRLAELYEARGDKIKASQWRARAGATGTPGRTQP